jgi:hypothetical protein
MGAKRNFLCFFSSLLFFTVRKMKEKPSLRGAQITIENRLVAPKSKFALTNFPVLSFLCRFSTRTQSHQLTKGKLCRDEAFLVQCVGEVSCGIELRMKNSALLTI